MAAETCTHRSDIECYVGSDSILIRNDMTELTFSRSRLGGVQLYPNAFGLMSSSEYIADKRLIVEKLHKNLKGKGEPLVNFSTRNFSWIKPRFPGVVVYEAVWN